MSNTKHTPGGAFGLKVMQMFHGYAVFQSGRVFSFTKWRGESSREMVQHENSHDYMRVRLVVKGKRKSYFVHKLVAELFMSPQPSAKHEIRHLDGDRTNNAYDNLAWGTRKDNADDRERHGRTARGLKHSNAIKKGIYNGRTK